MTEDIDPDNLPNYAAIELPNDKPRPEYNYNERRAALLRIVRQKGDPDAVTFSDVAKKFDVTRQTISKDMKRITAWIAHNLDPQKARAFSDSAYRKCIRELMEQDEYGKAARALDSWNDWLAEESVRDPEPDKYEHEHSGGVDGTQTIELDEETAAAIREATLNE